MRISDWSSDVCSSDLHVYIEQGCLYCHSQQPRSADQAPDDERGWGRASVASDYAYDHPHLMGTMRTGPDLLNVGPRLPSRDWPTTHLNQPRALAHWSQGRTSVVEGKHGKVRVDLGGRRSLHKKDN